MKICYIPPKKPNQDVKLNSDTLAGLLLMTVTCDPQVTLVFILCAILASVAGVQNVWLQVKSAKKKKIDKKLEEHERKKKIKKMYEEIEEERKGIMCKNVDTTNLI